MADQYGYQPYPVPTATPAALPERPKTLTYAVYGMWLGAVLTILGSVLLLTKDSGDMRRMMIEATEQQPGYDPSVLDAESMADVMVPIIMISAVVFGAITLGLWIWMAIVNAKGRSWARIVATVFGALAIASGMGNFANLGASSGAGMQVAFGGGGLALSIVNLALAIAIMVLLWLKPSSDYINTVTAHRKAAQGLR